MNASPPDRTQSLREIDTALADDAESLLQGDFETISEILDNIFDERAVSLDQDEEEELSLKLAEEMIGGSGRSAVSPSPGSPTEADAGETGDPDLSQTVEERIESESARAGEPDGLSARRRSAEASAVDLPETVVELSSPEPLEFEDIGAFESVEQVMSERGSLGAGRENEVVEATGSVLLPDREEDIEEVAPLHTEAIAGSSAEPVMRSEDPGPSFEAAPVEAPRVERFTRWCALASRARPWIIAALRGVNYPLRYVPPRMRPIVDWLALSLVFWVPIVWVMALFMF